MNDTLSYCNFDSSFGIFSFVPANENHIPALVSLLRLSGRGTYEFLLDDADEDTLTDWLATFITVPNSPYFYANWRVCLSENEVVAGMCLFPADFLGIPFTSVALSPEKVALSDTFSIPASEKDSYHLAALAVSDFYRHQKIGAVLISWALCEAKSQGYRRISLFCRTDNEQALAIYQHHGFDIIHETEDVTNGMISTSYFLARSV